MKSMLYQGVIALLALPFAAGKSLSPHGMNIESLAGEPMPAAVQAAAGGSSSSQMRTVEGALTNLLKHGAGAEGSNNSAVVSTILEIVNVTMRNRLVTAHKSSVKKIEEASKEYETCLGAYKAADKTRFPPAMLLQGDNWQKDEVEDYFAAYAWCKEYEQNQSVQFNQCEYACQNETIPREECVEIGKACDRLDCAPVTHEGYRAYLTRMLESLQKKLDANTNWTFHENNDKKCRQIPEIVHRCYETCDGKITIVKPKNETTPGACCAPRSSAETETCNVLKSRREAWEEYDSCYDAAATNWDTVKTEHEAEGVSRMAQMRSVLRMTCLIGSFGPDQSSKLKQCMETSYVKDPAVLQMKIDAGDIAPYHDKLDQFTCNASEVPGTDEFDAIHYKSLPKGLSACPAVSCEDACGLSDTSKKFKEVEVCVPLEPWQSTPIDTAMGWSKMGNAYALGAKVTCDSSFFWNVGSGSCQYAKCPDNSLRNVEDGAPNITVPTKGPGACPCKTKMHRRIEEPKAEVKSQKTTTCFSGINDKDAVYWDFGASQPLGKVTAEVNPGTTAIEVFITDSGPGSSPKASESCGTITLGSQSSADCVSHSGGRFLVLKGATGNCMAGDCKPSWCNMTVEGSAMKQDPMTGTGSLYMGQVVA